MNRRDRGEAGFKDGQNYEGFSRALAKHAKFNLADALPII